MRSPLSCGSSWPSTPALVATRTSGDRLRTPRSGRRVAAVLRGRRRAQSAVPGAGQRTAERGSLEHRQVGRGVHRRVARCGVRAAVQGPVAVPGRSPRRLDDADARDRAQPSLGGIFTKLRATWGDLAPDRDRRHRRPRHRPDAHVRAQPALGYEVVGFVGDDDLGRRAAWRCSARSATSSGCSTRPQAVGVVVSLASVSSDDVNSCHPPADRGRVPRRAVVESPRHRHHPACAPSSSTAGR